MDHTPRVTDTDDDDNDDDNELKFGDESDNLSQTQSESYSYQQRKIGHDRRKTVKLVTVDDNVLCPVISPLQMAHAEHECSKLIALNNNNNRICKYIKGKINLFFYLCYCLISICYWIK